METVVSHPVRTASFVTSVLTNFSFRAPTTQAQAKRMQICVQGPGTSRKNADLRGSAPGAKLRHRQSKFNGLHGQAQAKQLQVPVRLLKEHQQLLQAELDPLEG